MNGETSPLFLPLFYVKKVACPLFSAALLILAFPNFHLSFLAWVAFIPLFFTIDNSSKRKSFILSYLTGVIFFGVILYWLAYVTKLGCAVLVSYLALYFALFGLLANIFLKRLRASKSNLFSFLVLPSLWVALEFARGALFTGFPWAILGYTQYRNPLIIQIADITGSYGVSFLIMMVNFIVFAYLSNLIRREIRFRGLRFQLIVSTVILAAAVSYGYFALGEDNIDTRLKFSVVQGNIPQDMKWDPSYKDFILDRYGTMTKEAAKDMPDLIIWPETSVPGYLFEEDINLRLNNILNETGTPLFLGIVRYGWSKEGKDCFYNSASLLSAGGTIEKEYFKLHLVPFGEYVPLEKYFPSIRNFIDKPIGDYSAGEELTLFDISKHGFRFKYAALICFEDIFPSLVRRFAREGADILINMTNDAWFGESSEQLQHAQASVFRAVENRTSVVRAGNTGFSCYISPKGIIEDSIHDEMTGLMYTAGFKAFEIKISGKETFYTRFGDVFALLCILVILGTGLGLFAGAAYSIDTLGCAALPSVAPTGLPLVAGLALLREPSRFFC